MFNNRMIISQRSVQAHCNPRSCGCKELSRLRTDEEKIKHESTTMAIRNAGESADMKVITFNKHIGKRTVKCLEIPHYA